MGVGGERGLVGGGQHGWAWCKEVGGDARLATMKETQAGLHLISWVGFSAFWVLKTSVSCSSRCLSCSHTESLLQTRDRGHSLNSL